MAVVTVKSTQITNRDATPRVINPGRSTAGMVRHARGAVAIANGDSVASKYIFFSVPSRAVPISCRVSAPDIGTTTAGDIGLSRTTQDGGAVIDADFFKAAQALNTGPYTKVEVVNGNVATLANAERAIWELLGLATDPGIDYDVVLTLTGAADAAGAVQLELDYAI